MGSIHELNLYRHFEDNVIFAPAVPQHLPITVVTGFLGAGKTTILKNLAAQRAGVNIAMCVHEAAPFLNVDAHILSGEKALRCPDGPLPTFQEASYDGWVVPLDGCGCCGTYESSIKKSLSTLIQQGVDAGLVDYAVIETSGAEDPYFLLQLVNQQFGALYRARLESVVCVVDATAIPEDGVKRQLIERQLASADIVILNKLDLLEQGPDSHIRDDMLTWLESMPVRLVIARTMGAVDIAEVLNIEVLTGDVGLSHEGHTTLRVRPHQERKERTLPKPPDNIPHLELILSSLLHNGWEVREWSGGAVDPLAFLAFCRDVVNPLTPNVIWRAKGVFACQGLRWEWNVSGTRRTTFAISPWESEPFSKVALIGKDLPLSPFDAFDAPKPSLSVKDVCSDWEDIWEDNGKCLFRLTGARRFGYCDETDLASKVKVDLNALQESFALRFNLHRESQGVCVLLPEGNLMFALHENDAEIVRTIADACLQVTFANVTSCKCGQ